MAERLNLTVGDGVGDKLSVLAGGERKRGAYLSVIVRELCDDTPSEEIDEVGTLERMEAKIDRLMRIVAN